jgi:coenzyme PQQ precursor peptide PqqA
MDRRITIRSNYDIMITVNQSLHFHELLTRRYIMWTKPAATEMRFGFEVTMYVMNK